jgi:D-xylose transport system substrate-binding protein
MEGRWFTDIEYLKKHAADAGVELIIKVAGGNENLQLEQANQLVKEGVGVFIVIPVNQNTAAGIVRTAHDANLKVIAYDRIIMNSDLDYFLTFEYYDLGLRQAEYAHKKVPKGNYVMLWGDAMDNNARLMRQGQEDYLKPYIESGDVNLIYRTFVEDWAEINAERRMQRVLDFTNEPIDVLIASNDNLALAALDVIVNNNIKQPEVITGQDATIDACRSIMRGGQTMSIYKSTNMMALEAINLAIDIMNQHRISKSIGTFYNNRIDVPTLYLPPAIVDKTNLIETVVGDGMFTYDEIMAD